jgi:hypothetical protein
MFRELSQQFQLSLLAALLTDHQHQDNDQRAREAGCFVCAVHYFRR